MNMSAILRRAAANLLLSAASLLSAQIIPQNSPQSLAASSASDITCGLLWDDLQGELPPSALTIVPGFPVWMGGQRFDTLQIGQGLITGFAGNHTFSLGIHADLCDRGLATGVHASPLLLGEEGLPGNRIVTVEWRNAGFYEEWSYGGTLRDSLNIQIRFYEYDGHAEIRFGDGFYAGVSGFRAGLMLRLEDENGSRLHLSCLQDSGTGRNHHCSNRLFRWPQPGTVQSFGGRNEGNTAFVPLLRAEHGGLQAVWGRLIRIYGLDGRFIREVKAEKSRFDVSALATGVYIVHLSDADTKSRVVARLFVPGN